MILLHIEKPPERCDIPAALRFGQRQRALGAEETNRRLGCDAPPAAVDFDCPPRRIAKIEVKLAVSAGDADVNRQFGAIEARPGLEHGERGFQCFRVRRAPSCFVKSSG
jgi:hypothetical protein